MPAFLTAFVANLAASAWAAGVSLVALAVVIWPLERLFPARPGQPLFRPQWGTDLAFFAGQYLLWVSLAAVAIHALDARLIDPLIPHALRARFAAWPLALQAVVVVMLGDISVYWLHRACHAVPFLWRFHAVHHSAEHLDWLAAHREHPVDGLLTQLAVNAPALVLGFSLGQIAWLIALRGMWAIFVHSNVRLPLGPLRVLLGAPELHHWHHLRSDRVQNFGNLSPWTDLLFGTHHDPRGPEAWPLGTDPPLPRSYLGMLAQPLWPSPSRHAERADVDRP
ncbi:MAG TPA: sterol desaturase family protein [Polyangia bacterium]|nr:sterol desaturase family protein [Polyangia bacterium]